MLIMFNCVGGVMTPPYEQIVCASTLNPNLVFFDGLQSCTEIRAAFDFSSLVLTCR